MKFNKLYYVILEKNIYYKIPKDNIVKLYDFYYLTHLFNKLNSKSTKHKAPGGDVYGDLNWYGLRDKSLKTSLEEAVEIIVNNLYSTFHDEVINQVIDELNSMLEMDDDDIELMKKKFDDIDEYNTRIDELPISDREKLKLIILMTNKKSSQYLQRWNKVAKGWLRLDKAKTLDEKIVAIDHIFDLEHGGYFDPDNYSPFLSRIKFGTRSSYGDTELVKALNRKAQIKSIWELEPYVSSLARSIGVRISKALNLGTKNDAPKKKHNYEFSFSKPNLINPTPETFIKWIKSTFGEKLTRYSKNWNDSNKNSIAVRNINYKDRDEDDFMALRYDNGHIHIIDDYTEGRPIIKSYKIPNNIISAKWLVKTLNMDI